MTTSNSIFFEVVETPPLHNVGWQVQVREPVGFGQVVAIIPDFSELSVGPELSAPGAASITLDADHPIWAQPLRNGQPATTLKDQEFLWEAYEDGALRFQWLSQRVEEKPVEDDESRDITISGPGVAQVLSWAVIMRPGYPHAIPPNLKRPGTTMADADSAQSYSDAQPSYSWRFPPTWPTMKMWYTLFTSAQNRGVAPWVRPTFTAEKDSGGAKWEWVATQDNTGTTLTSTVGDAQPLGYAPTLGMNLLDFLAECTGQDPDKYLAERLEWVMRPGLMLEVRKSIGVHREKQVIFHEGLIQQIERTRSREELVNHVVVTDEYGAESIAADAASIAKWNRRESYQDKFGTLTDPARRIAAARTFLEQKKDEKSGWVITVPADLPGRRPFRDFTIGDWIGIGAFNDQGESTWQPYRVLAIVVNVQGEVPTCELTLHSKFDAQQLELQRKLTYIINHPSTGSGKVNLPQDGTGAVIRNPDGSYTLDPNYNLGGGGGTKVWIQPEDPGGAAQVGDFWYDTSYISTPLWLVNSEWTRQPAPGEG